MGGFAGIINLKKNIQNEKNNIIKMSRVLEDTGPDECGYFVNHNIVMSHRRLMIIDSEGRQTTYDI